jgi:hypothetical protein
MRITRWRRRDFRSALNDFEGMPGLSGSMRIALPLLLLTATPALAEVAPHSGLVHARSMPELSDIALFAIAVLGVWIVRRAMRARFRREAVKPRD